MSRPASQCTSHAGARLSREPCETEPDLFSVSRNLRSTGVLEWALPHRAGPHMAKALSQIHPEWVFDGCTAAAIRGWNVSYSLLDRLSIVAPYQVQSKSIIARSSKHITHEILHGIRVTTVAQTLHQCLRAGDLRTTLPIADSALRVTGKTSAASSSCSKTIRRSLGNMICKGRLMSCLSPMLAVKVAASPLRAQR